MIHINMGYRNLVFLKYFSAVFISVFYCRDWTKSWNFNQQFWCNRNIYDPTSCYPRFYEEMLQQISIIQFMLISEVSCISLKLMCLWYYFMFMNNNTRTVVKLCKSLDAEFVVDDLRLLHNCKLHKRYSTLAIKSKFRKILLGIIRLTLSFLQFCRYICHVPSLICVA